MFAAPLTAMFLRIWDPSVRLMSLDSMRIKTALSQYPKNWNLSKLRSPTPSMIFETRAIDCRNRELHVANCSAVDKSGLPNGRSTMSLQTVAKKSALSLISMSPSLRRVALRYCVDYLQLPHLLTATPSHAVRAILMLPPGESSSQLNQDIFALLFNRFRPGYFLEIGANDGTTLSNTLYLETEFGWRGGLIEANPRYEAALKKRRADVLMKGIGGEEVAAQFVDAGLYGGLASQIDATHEKHTQGAPRIDIQLTTLTKALTELSAPKVIDFLSVDVEGAERSIILQLVESEYRVRCGCIEVNSREKDRSEVKRVLTAHNYRVVWEGQTYQDLFFVDASAG